MPDTCITHVWITIEMVAYNPHVDDRNFGVGLLSVPENYNGGELVISNPDFDVIHPIYLKKGNVLAGLCFQSHHYNQPVI
jgi:hypothetical protein